MTASVPNLATKKISKKCVWLLERESAKLESTKSTPFTSIYLLYIITISIYSYGPFYLLQPVHHVCAGRCHQRRQSRFISHSWWRGRAQNVSRLKPGMSRPVMSSLAGAAGAVLRSQMLQKNFDKQKTWE